jgi:hypothetical protein
MKILLVEEERTDGWKDGETDTDGEANSSFRNFAKAPNIPLNPLTVTLQVLTVQVRCL